MVTTLLVTGTVLAVAIAAGFAVLVAGIQVSEKRTGLAGPPRCRADAFARRVLCAHVGQLEASPALLAGTSGQRPGSRAPSPCSPARPGSVGSRSGECS